MCVINSTRLTYLFLIIMQFLISNYYAIYICKFYISFKFFNQIKLVSYIKFISHIIPKL
jgi:hypothetical protein